ncbi:hypothetical protein NADFUDRAFT_84335 [Nadsonia fulvescens var. elongata DSM 6958]|uniref:UBL3-like ubiquitin domain-containing protein n=1 Tax=Nadsonia fulvescens var. elongata DSM 6958 TaxID=857566 RepID=A0A1E3PEC4_9ASCO|nr:hypothetical protein NADFUDRAFT_84335 [Nadsonia fulvescens var. elongata DSM 6958]
MDFVSSSSTTSSSGLDKAELSLVFLLANGERITLDLNDEYIQLHQEIISSLAEINDEPKSAANIVCSAPLKAIKACLIDDWRPEVWGEKPASVENLRVIYLGKILDDDLTFQDYNIGNSLDLSPSTTTRTKTGKIVILHLSVRPAVFDNGTGIDALRSNQSKFRLRLHRKVSAPAITPREINIISNGTEVNNIPTTASMSEIGTSDSVRVLSTSQNQQTSAVMPNTAEAQTDSASTSNSISAPVPSTRPANNNNNSSSTSCCCVS